MLIREHVISCDGRDGAKDGWNSPETCASERQQRSLKITEDHRALACEYLQLGQGKYVIIV